MKNSSNVFNSVILNDLCSGCGGCVAICPTDALTIDSKNSYKPTFNKALCIECGRCYEVCPGKGYSVWEAVRSMCDDQTELHPLYGPVRHFWLGHSTDSNIRLGSASGGVATSLLLHLLAAKTVDYVAVVQMEDGYPVFRMTDDPQVILSAKASKYSPVSMDPIIEALKENPCKIAMTVTPCQLAAFRAATEKLPKIRNCLVLSIGLFCGYVKDYESVSSIAATLEIQYPGEAEFLGWRCGPYPGSARFRMKDGSFREKPLYPWLDIAVPHYALHRCFLCPDGGNWLADMTFGDIHSGGTDETVIVCRTAQAEEMLRSAEENGKIELSDMSQQQVNNCVVRHMTGSKLKPALSCIQWRKSKKYAVPEYDYPLEEIFVRSTRGSRALSVIKYRLSFLIRKALVRKFLKKHPHLMEKTGHFLYRFPSTIPGWGMLLRIRNVFLKND